jgi:uncharacterized membrane protein
MTEENQEGPRDLEARIEQLTLQVKKMLAADFTEILEFAKHPWRLIWSNFLIGIIRGTGMAIGFTILGAIVIWFIFKLLQGMIDLPLIGEFIARMIAIVKEQT